MTSQAGKKPGIPGKKEKMENIRKTLYIMNVKSRLNKKLGKKSEVVYKLIVCASMPSSSGAVKFVTRIPEFTTKIICRIQKKFVQLQSQQGAIQK